MISNGLYREDMGPCGIYVCDKWWLWLQVCREFQRGACKRSECRFAHPTDASATAPDGTVTVCMDAVKGRCSRDPCRYFHPPLHLQAHIKAAHSVGQSLPPPLTTTTSKHHNIYSFLQCHSFQFLYYLKLSGVYLIYSIL